MDEAIHEIYSIDMVLELSCRFHPLWGEMYIFLIPLLLHHVLVGIAVPDYLRTKLDLSLEQHNQAQLEKATAAIAANPTDCEVRCVHVYSPPPPSLSLSIFFSIRLKIVDWREVK